MAILDRRGRFVVGAAQGDKKWHEQAHGEYNAGVRRQLVARLQELVEQHLPAELEFFCDWLGGDFGDDELWEKHIHATVETSCQQRAAQIRGRLQSIFRRLKKLADDDLQIQLILEMLAPNINLVNDKQVEDDDNHWSYK